MIAEVTVDIRRDCEVAMAQQLRDVGEVFAVCQQCRRVGMAPRMAEGPPPRDRPRWSGRRWGAYSLRALQTVPSEATRAQAAGIGVFFARMAADPCDGWGCRASVPMLVPQQDGTEVTVQVTLGELLTLGELPG